MISIFRFFGHNLKLNLTLRSFSSKFEDFRKPQEVVVTSKDGIFVIGMNGQKNKNALSSTFVSLLSSTLDELKRNKLVKVLILKSLVNGVFCAGADLKERLEMSNEEVASFVGMFETKKYFCFKI